MDEEWALVEERFEEMLEHAGGVEFTSWGGSAAVMPHVLRHRVRVPWEISARELPSSHSVVSTLSPKEE